MARGIMTGGQRRPRPAAARRLQRRLAGRVRLADELPAVGSVAGVDCGFPDGGRSARAAVVVMAWPSLDVLDQRVVTERTRFPYVPGLLSFRELPVILTALAALDHRPDLVLCDGQGIAHPRRFGIAAHLGIATGHATIGVGKSRLTGDYETPGERKGEWSPLTEGGERIGTVLRTRDGVRPLFVSPGHRVGHDTAAAWVLACCPRYRLPEPIRAADRLASGRL